MTWREVQEVTALMPHLRSLEFGYNCLTSLELAVSPQPTIQVLNLDSNECHDWFQICQALHPYSA
jgi:hypothetical protein